MCIIDAEITLPDRAKLFVTDFRISWIPPRAIIDAIALLTVNLNNNLRLFTFGVSMIDFASFNHHVIHFCYWYWWRMDFRFRYAKPFVGLYVLSTFCGWYLQYFLHLNHLVSTVYSLYWNIRRQTEFTQVTPSDSKEQISHTRVSDQQPRKFSAIPSGRTS